ncbi:MAG: aminodeoxychorismate synthase component I [Candidatus Omnitrophica bacterium]|nr:aminodeoxychorismate synthase component I [Candidatus Omnitrophota bacterium]
MPITAKRNTLEKDAISPLIEEIELKPTPSEIVRIFEDAPYTSLFESQMDHGKLGRFSILCSDPFMVFKSNGREAHLISGKGERLLNGNPFKLLKELLAKYKIPAQEASLPFYGGVVGFFGYDMGRCLEKIPSMAKNDLKAPECILGFYDRALIFDHLMNKKYVVSSGLPESNPEKAKRRAKARLEELKEILSLSIDTRASSTRKRKPPKLSSNFTKATYRQAIGRIKDYIAAGDVYQVTLSQRFDCELRVKPAELYRRLKAINPAPFASFLNFEDVKIVSSSPERFISIRDGEVHTRPIKGTSPRGSSTKEDDSFKELLKASQKDRAEHVMIVDLERNDLGRVCEYGSISVSEFELIEKYSTVFHMVSTVRGKLREGKDAIDCLMNSFPGGSITGAPKIRSMEVIEELEPTRRSVYTGAIGYIGFDGNMDTSIVIRTFIIKGKKVYFQVGGGIVWDSDPDAEYQETLDKAKALIEVISNG